MPPPRARSAVIAAMVLLLLGAAVAAGVGDALGLTFTPVAAPPVGTPPAQTPPLEGPAAPTRPADPAPAIGSLDVPAGERLRAAATAVADALVAAGAPRPSITTDGRAADLVVRLVTPTPEASPASEAYRIRTTQGRFTVETAGVAGAAAGLYTIADRIRAGRPVARTSELEQPRLGLRLTDAGSVGRTADPAAFSSGTDYSLNTDVTAGAVLPQAPWVDAAAAARIDADFRQLVRRVLAEGYNGMVVPGFLEYVTFAKVGGGNAVYPAGDPHIARARAMVAAFAPMLEYAHDLGLRIYLLTDMLAVSPPLEAYLTRTVGGLSTEDTRLWSVYQAGLAELFEQFPSVAGLMIRIGEGGAAYQAGWDYSSKLAVTTGASVQAMLHALLSTARDSDREIIFRTWTVGVGAVGDLHTNPDSYQTVLGDVHEPNLIVSTKYTSGDFYSHLPLNPTLSVGDQRRIVEFQARREFEGFGALPNSLIAEEQQALRRFLASNPHVEGVWNWTQDGGPLHAGPMSLYLKAGFWPLYDLNTYGTARLAADPAADPTALVVDWVRQTFSPDPSTVDALTGALGLSREAIVKGLYIGPYAENSVRALGLEPPPMMWIFEWDIVSGDSAALDSIYAVARPELERAIAEADQAVTVAARMRSLVAGTDPATWRSPELRQSFVDSLDYEVDLLQTLGRYRTMVLRHVQWLDTGSATAYQAWQQAEVQYQLARQHHLDRFTGDLDHPAYNFTAADIGAARADRDVAMAWIARALLILLIVALLLGTAWGQRRLGGGRVPGAAALRALWIGATQPWRFATLPANPGRFDRVLVWLLPALALVVSRAAFSWLAAPSHLLMTLGGWLLFAVVLRLLVRGRDPFALWAAIGGVALARTVILLVALAARGPGRYWFNFWTAPTLRSVYITIAFAAFGWLFVVTVMVLGQRYGFRGRRAVGSVLLGAGLTLGLLAGLVAAIGLERALTVWNDQLALLPWGLSRILGITVYLGIPPSLPTIAAVVGVVVAVAGSALAVPRDRS